MSQQHTTMSFRLFFLSPMKMLAQATANQLPPSNPLTSTPSSLTPDDNQMQSWLFPCLSSKAARIDLQTFAGAAGGLGENVSAFRRLDRRSVCPLATRKRLLHKSQSAAPDEHDSACFRSRWRCGHVCHHQGSKMPPRGHL